MSILQVSSTIRSNNSGSTPQVATFPNPLTAGSTVLFIGANYSATNMGSAVISDGSQSLTLDGVYPAGNNKGHVYSKKNITSTGASNPTVTITPGSSSDNYISGIAVEISEKVTYEATVNAATDAGNRTFNYTPATASSFAVSVLVLDADTTNGNLSPNSGVTQLDYEQSTIDRTGYISGYSYNTGTGAFSHVWNNPTYLTAGLMVVYSVDSGGGPTEYTITPSGGVVFSGEPNVARERVFSVSGGVSFGGTADAVLNKNYIISPSGGIVFGGAPNILRERAIVPSGGIVFSGAAAFGYERILSPSGGAIFGGTGNITFEPTSGTTYTITPSGGVAFSGASDVLRERTIAPNGGITFSGASTLQRERSIIPSGGIIFDGSATFNADHIIVPNGGIVFGGNGGMFFIPAGGGSGLLDAQRLNVKVSKAMGL